MLIMGGFTEGIIIHKIWVYIFSIGFCALLCIFLWDHRVFFEMLQTMLYVLTN